MFDPRKYIATMNNSHLRRVESYVRLLEPLFNDANKEFARLAMQSDYKFDGSEPFDFSNFPALKKQADKVVAELANGMSALIGRSTSAEWAEANEVYNNLVGSVLSSISRSKKDLTDDLMYQYFNNHDDALKAFQARKVAGFRISDRVWELAHRQEIDAELGISISKGKSAEDLALELQQYLKNPDNLFRRVRDEFGDLQLSKRASETHTGTGVYRSSFKNAMRLARNEINIAYRTAENQRYQDFDFIVGKEIKRSTHEYECNDICERLKGKYPKDFKFVGWHVQCRCFEVPILCTDEELEAMLDSRREGQDYTLLSTKQVDDVPSSFKEWVVENTDRIDRAKAKGVELSFVKDNESYIKNIEPVKTGGYHLTESVVDELKARGFIRELLDYNDYLSCEPLQRFDLVSFDDKVTSICDENGIQIRRRRVSAYNSKMSVRYYGVDDRFELVRDFRVRPDGVFEVGHEFFVLSEDLQGKGISKKMLQAMYSEYQKAGVDEVKMLANIDVGGYCWAKYGFKTQQYNVKRIIEKSKGIVSDSCYEKAMKVYEDFYRSRSSVDYFPMNLLSDIPEFKTALLGTKWEGILQFSDKDALKVFESYLGL